MVPTPNSSPTTSASSKPTGTRLPDIATVSVPETLTALHVNSGIGLTHREVEIRRKAHGYNEVAEKKGHPALNFLRKFWGISAWMLELIMVLSAVLGKYSDLAVVSALLVVNAVLGFLQEHRAAGVVEALRRRLHVNARVLRDAVWHVIPARELVPGDIVRLRPGDIIPADVKLLRGALTVDQSALTGESKDADKTSGDVVSSGSVVRRGEGNSVVILTGAKTYFGRTTQLVQEARPKLHIEAVVTKVVRWLFAIVGTLLGVVVILSLVRGDSLLEMVPLILVLLSAIPVALPVMFTVSMAVGSKELARRGVLVTRLSAVEDAATMDVLCVDKTGTITMNQLAVTGVIPLEHATEADVLFAGALASQEAKQDPIDLAFLAAAKERHIFDNLPKVTPVSFLPFDAKNRKTEAVVEQSGQRIRMIKGAVRTIAEACGLQPPAIQALETRVSDSAAKGYRSLAVGRGPEAGTPTLVGLVSLYDPPRPDAKELIAALQGRGVTVKMLTGDALAVATEIARGVGLQNIRRMADVKAASTQAANNKTVDSFAGADGFAEVFPEDKYIVVKRLQAAGHVTGMTGDGVNDAPALRQAEVGIAVSTATDVAKGAASVVLTGPGLTNIVTLVEQGRTIYQRLLTWIINKISRTILKAGFVAIAYVVTGKFVVSAFAMLLLTFMTDFARIALATDHVRPSKKPETWNIGGFVTVSVVLGVAMVAETLLLLKIVWSHFGLATNDAALYTFSFLMLLYFAVFSVVSARQRRSFWSTMPSKTLMAALIADALTGTILTRVGLPGLMSLSWPQTFAICAYAMVSCLVVNLSLIHISEPTRLQLISYAVFCL